LRRVRVDYDAICRLAARRFPKKLWKKGDIMNETNEKLIESQRKARAENAKKIIEETNKSNENNPKPAPQKVAPKKITLEIESVEPEKHKISKKDIIITTIFVIAGFFLALLIKPEVIDDFKRILK
jgi:hypothetical protein